ncbi:MAG TPA: hypothetical protein VL500_06685 [Candidatus Eisenbacteria bacterium]|nr:hypothetical protein [Candidatus Eisenbacteria bacterium]
MRPPLRIGIDLDGVVIDHRAHKQKLAQEYGFVLEPWQTNTNVMRRYVPEEIYRPLQESLYTHLTKAAPAVHGALETLPHLKAELYIVSARRADTIRYAQDWLVSHRIYDFVPAERIYFCGSDEEKKGYCDRLGIDMFLDDKVRVLEALSGRTKRVLFDEDAIAEQLQVQDRLHIARTWEEFREMVNAKVAA